MNSTYSYVNRSAYRNGKKIEGITTEGIFVLTVRHGDSFAYKGVQERCEHQPERLAKGTGYVLYALLDFVVDLAPV